MSTFFKTFFSFKECHSFFRRKKRPKNNVSKSNQMYGWQKERHYRSMGEPGNKPMSTVIWFPTRMPKPFWGTNAWLWFFQWSCMDVRLGLWRKLSAEELMLLNCDVGEYSWESLGLQRRSNQSILKEISPGCSLKGLMLKLKLQYFGHLMQRADSFEKTLMLGKIVGRKRRGQQRMRKLDGIIDSMDMGWVDSGSWWWTGRPGLLRFMGSQRIGHNWEMNWTELTE